MAEMYQNLTAANSAFEEAEGSVNRTSKLGMIVVEEENLLAEARTKLITARAAQHTSNLDKVLEESDASIALSEQAHQQAENDIKESRFRRQAMIIAVLVISLVVLSLVMLRRQLS